MLENVVERSLYDTMMLLAVAGLCPLERARYTTSDSSGIGRSECHRQISINFRALYRVRLARSGLTVSEDGSIVALHAAISDRLGNRIENCSLTSALSANEIKVEILAVGDAIKHYRASINLLNAQVLAHLRVLLALTQGSYADAHLDIILLIDATVALKDAFVDGAAWRPLTGSLVALVVT